MVDVYVFNNRAGVAFFTRLRSSLWLLNGSPTAPQREKSQIYSQNNAAALERSLSIVEDLIFESEKVIKRAVLFCSFWSLSE